MSRLQAYLYSGAGVGALALTGVASGVLSSRILGPEGRGELTALIFLPSLAGQMAGTGISQALAYLDNDARGTQPRVAASAVLLMLVSGCLLAMLALPLLSVLLPHLPSRMVPTAAICLAYIPLCFVYRVLLGASLAKGDFRGYSWLQVLAGVAQMLLMALFWAAGLASPETFAFAVVLAIAVVLLARAGLLSSLLSWREVSASAARKVLAKTWEFTRPELASVALLRCDVLLLTRMVPDESLGLYAVALAIATGQSIMAPAMAQVAFHATRSAPNRAAGAESFARQFCFLQLVFAGIAVMTLAAIPVLIRVAFGAKFIGGAGTASVLVFAMAVWSCSQVVESGLRGMAMASACIWSNLIGLPVLVVSSLFLVPAMGIQGMGWSMFAAQSVSLAAKLLFLVRATDCQWSLFWALSSSRIREFKAAAIEYVIVPLGLRVSERSASIGAA